MTDVGLDFLLLEVETKRIQASKLLVLVFAVGSQLFLSWGKTRSAAWAGSNAMSLDICESSILSGMLYA